MLNGGMSRIPQPGDRRVGQRPESVQRKPDSQAARPEESAAPQPAAQRVKPAPAKSVATGKRPVNVILAILLILALGVIGWLVAPKLTGGLEFDTDKYQAVAVSDGQIYFGKVTPVDADHIRLTDAYYLQAEMTETTAATEETAPAQPGNVRLIKLSNKIYGPEDGIVLSKSQIVSYENLASDGQVAEWLKENSGN